MTSQFNVLYRGSATDAADQLDGDDPPAAAHYLRAALTNALRRIAQLETRLAALDDPLKRAVGQTYGAAAQPKSDLVRRITMPFRGETVEIVDVKVMEDRDTGVNWYVADFRLIGESGRPVPNSDLEQLTEQEMQAVYDAVRNAHDEDLERSMGSAPDYDASDEPILPPSVPRGRLP